MKRNGFDQVAHARYLATVADRIQSGVDPRSIYSYRKHKYNLHRNNQTATIERSTDPNQSPPPDTVNACTPSSSDYAYPEGEEDITSTNDVVVSKYNHNSVDPALQARHAYLMQLIFPALRNIKAVSVHPVATRAADALQQAQPCARDGASLTTCGDMLVLFGGCYTSDPSLLHPRTLVPPRQTAKSTVFYSNHVFSYMPESKLWDAPHVSGPCPKGRADHSAVYVPATSSLVVFGGRGKHSVVFQDVFCLHVASWTWSQVKSDANDVVPPPRFWHCAAFDTESNAMYVFGGKDLYTVYGDMQYWHHKYRSWGAITALGQPPSPRFGAALHWLGPGRIAVLGGWEARSVPLRGDASRWLDMFVLDVVAGIWSRPHLSAHFLGRSIPTERMLPATFLLDPTTLVVFGGYTYGPDTGLCERPWYELEPPPRTTALPSPSRLLHGMKLEPVNDEAIYTLKLDVMVWRRQKQTTPLPTSVACGAGAVWRGQGVLAAISQQVQTQMEVVVVVADFPAAT
ncbi:hypothetical protein AaE_002006 [Aphanomyces astaci]|uniref:Uncharacterized protein n=1 Tax=Aphanomyces astaci TaxID=112090 RepID=A0A6A5B060_APHAT|nr:hypothetical protein AaE_002006 [Aphanomyces astaci]